MFDRFLIIPWALNMLGLKYDKDRKYAKVTHGFV